MNRISRNLTTIYRTERLIARRRIAIVQKQTVFMALAGLAALTGLILMNITIYLVLTKWVSPPVAAGILAVANLGIAGIFASIAGRTNVEHEIEPAVEVRDLAIADLEAELEGMTAEARQTVNAIKGLGANPLGSATALLVPMLTAALKKKS